MKKLLPLIAITIPVISFSQTQQPNIILINVDDMGWADLGCYGADHRISTPNIDTMAMRGVRFTDFYAAAPVSTPSRAALLSGQYPIKSNMHKGVIFPYTEGGLAPEKLTIAEQLKKVGYKTACIGKWHVGHSDLSFMPNNQGFDYYYGIPYSNDMDNRTYKDFQAPPLPLYKNKKVIEGGMDQRFFTQRFTAEAVRLIEKCRDNQPIFIYLAHPMPHTPIHASPKFMHTSKYGAYGDTVQEVDWSVGVIFKALKERGIYDNTLVIFTSDNGPDTGFWMGNNHGSASPLRGGKAQTWEGGIREPCIMFWSGKIAAGSTYCDIASQLDLLPTLSSIAGCSIEKEMDLDGTNIMRLIENPDSERTLFYYATNGNIEAVRKGEWKLHIAKSKGWDKNADGNFRTQLYNMKNDASESCDLAFVYPEIVAELQTIIDKQIVKDSKLKIK